MAEVLERYDGIARISRAGPPGMVALKADLGSDALAAVLGLRMGLPVPETRRWTDGGGGRALWMAPDELLLLVPDAAAVLAALRAVPADWHVTAADVSDLRAVFRIQGSHSRDVLAKLMPVDFSDLSPGYLRRSRLAQVAALVWAEESQTFGVMTLRSVADYAWGVLTLAARPGGEVGLHR